MSICDSSAVSSLGAQTTLSSSLQWRQMEKQVAKLATKTHKERVHEFNSKLESLSEHHDIPKARRLFLRLWWFTNTNLHAFPLRNRLGLDKKTLMAFARVFLKVFEEGEGCLVAGPHLRGVASLLRALFRALSLKQFAGEFSSRRLGIWANLVSVLNSFKN